MSACARCLRRSFLLAELSPVLDHLAGQPERLNATLALSDAALIEALGGRRRDALRAWHETFDPAHVPSGGSAESACSHDPLYPDALGVLSPAPMLSVAGGAARLARLAAAPVVALLGSTRASDYGRAFAHSLARSLTASGVTVAASLTDGIGAAAHTGAQEAGGASVAVLGGGLGAGCPAQRRALYARVTEHGCALSELPHDAPGRRWGRPAAERVAVALSALVVLVEAHENPRELAAARTAAELGRRVAAVPGRVTSPLSSGPHALLVEGAGLVRDAADVLELLYQGSEAPKRAAREPIDTRREGLTARRAKVLELVACGADTPDRLLAAGAQPDGLLGALTELELLGALARGENGRYVALPRHAGEPIGGSATAGPARRR